MGRECYLIVCATSSRTGVKQFMTVRLVKKEECITLRVRCSRRTRKEELDLVEAVTVKGSLEETSARTASTAMCLENANYWMEL